MRETEREHWKHEKVSFSVIIPSIHNALFMSFVEICILIPLNTLTALEWIFLHSFHSYLLSVYYTQGTL